MGNCGLATSRSRRGQTRKPPAVLPTAKVVHASDGTMDKYEEAVSVRNVVARSPGYYVCSGEAMEIGVQPPAVAESEELRPGHLYFLLPVSSSRRPLSLPDLCQLAAKADKALFRDFR